MSKTPPGAGTPDAPAVTPPDAPTAAPRAGAGAGDPGGNTGDGRVAVLTDSAASIPPELAVAAGVTVVPMSVVLDGESQPDGPATPARAPGAGRVATSAPSPGDWLNALESLGGRPAVLVTVSARMSASYGAAVTAASYRRDGPVTVLDSQTAAGAQGLAVLAAAKTAAAGASVAAVAAEARRVTSSVRLVACLQSLDQVARSGRVPAAAAWAGRTLRVVPVFEFVRGEARARRPAAGWRRAVERMVTACRAGQRPGSRLHAAVLSAGWPEPAAAIHSAVRAADPGADCYLAPFSAVMVAHTGPGLAGLAWWWGPSPEAGPTPAPR